MVKLTYSLCCGFKIPLQKSQYLQFDLSDQESSKIREAMSHIQYDPTGSPEYIYKVRSTAYKKFPARLLKLMEFEKSTLKPHASIVINHLPIDANITGSPAFNETGSFYKSGTISENTLVAISLLLGEPFSISFESHELVNNIVPNQHHQNAYTALGALTELDFHIENAALNFLVDDDCSPSGLLLLGIRREPTTPVYTYFSDVRLALQLLDPQTIYILRSPLFNIKLPYRWRDALKQIMTKKVSLISGPELAPRAHAAFYNDIIDCQNTQAEMALQQFHNAVKAVSAEINLQPGQLIYINNKIAFHARSAFKPIYNAYGVGNRWLQRVCISSDLWPMRRFKNINRIYYPDI